MAYHFPSFPKPHPSRVNAFREKKKVAVLSIDGGGIRGLIPALIMDFMEKQTGRRICELFDLVAGTSTGGILSILSALPEEAGSTTPSSRTTGEELIKLYKERGAEIFPQQDDEGTDMKSFLSKVKSTVGDVKDTMNTMASALSKPKYTAAGLEKVVHDYTVDKHGKPLTLADTVIPVYVSAVEMEQPWGPIFFSSLDARADGGANGCNYLVSDVARATSAAPTFLPPKKMSNVVKETAMSTPTPGHVSLTCVDGGICCNNPSLAVLNYVRGLVDPDTEITIISLGTGRVAEAYDCKAMQGWGAAKWIEPLISTMMQGSSKLMHDQIETIAAADSRIKYHRFQMMIPEEYTSKTTNKEWQQSKVGCERMDNIRKKNLDIMTELVVSSFLPEIENALGKALQQMIYDK
ncbi:Patatin-like protein 2 [Diplonema papillatum]|nr:Patatin-like protein 2 [Diplonema papillatum]